MAIYLRTRGKFGFRSGEKGSGVGDVAAACIYDIYMCVYVYVCV